MTSAFASPMPGTSPSRRALPPPVPTWFNPNVGGADPIESCFRVQQQAHGQYADWLAAHSHDIDPDVLKGNSGAFQDAPAAKALGPALAGAIVYANEADEDAKAPVAELAVPDDKHDAARRIWDRSRPQLDAATSPQVKVAVAQSLIANAQGLTLETLAEELPAYFAAVKLPGGRPLPMDWLTDALAARVPGAGQAQAESRLRSRRVAALQQNHTALTRAIAKQNPPPTLLDSSAASITATPYTNGEPFSPSDAE